MALHFFGLGKLRVLDGGRVEEAFAQAVKRCVADCEDRPAEENARKVNLQVEFIPVMDSEGHCEGVSAAFQVKDTIPTRKSRIYSFGVKAGQRLFFSDEDPHNVSQLTFGDVDPETGRASRNLDVEDES
jgi:hypothetical protein